MATKPLPALLTALVWVVRALTLAGAAGAGPFTLVLKNGGMTQVGAAGAPAEWGGHLPRRAGLPARFGRRRQERRGLPDGPGRGRGDVDAGGLVQDGRSREGVGVRSGVRGQGDSDWGTFSKPVTLPPWTAFFTVGVLIEGDGRAWLDDVHKTSAPVDGGAT